MRERCPVAFSDELGWSVFRHEDIVTILADPETFSSGTKRLNIPNGMDPPEHTMYRDVLEPYFSPARMAVFEPFCRQIATDQVRMLLESKDPDFVTGFADPFPLKTACRFLGWPPETWERLHGWTHGNQQASFSRDRELGARIAREYAEHVRQTLRARRDGEVEAGDDVTTGLMETTVNGEPLSDDDIVSILRTWTAGHGTISAALGILALHLAEDQNLQQQLRADPSLAPAAIDEILRVDGPLVSNRRTTTRPVRVGDREIDAAENISLMWIAANRDERAFDDAGDVQIHRDQRNNLLFGADIHVCLGAPLARLEMRIAVEELLAHTTTIALHGDEPLSRDAYPSNGLTRLHIRAG
jgi:cytochrome P450